MYNLFQTVYKSGIRVMSGFEIIQSISKWKIRTIICLIAFITLSAIFIIDHSQAYGQDYSKTDLNELNRYIARNPNDVYALIDRGLIYHDNGKFDKAIADFSKAIHLDPDNINAYYFRGMTYGKMREFDRSVRDFRSAIDIDPNFVGAYRMLGFTYYEMRQYDHALEIYAYALELNPDDPLLYLYRGDVHYVREDYKQAIENYQIALRIDPSLEPAREWLEKAQALIETEDEDTGSLFGENPFGDEPNGDDDYGFDEMDTTQWFTDLEETPAGSYSEDQIEIVNRLGPPESFTIMICATDEESDETVRTEIWNYYSMQSRFVFTDGKLIMTEEIEAIDENAVMPEYTPDRFVYGMSFKEVIDILGEKEFALAEVIDEYVENGDLYFTEQLVLGFKDDRLFYVESLPLIPEEDED